MKKKLLYSECKTVLTVFALLLSVLSWGQNSNPKILSQASGNSSHELKTTEQNPLEMMKGKREDISKRDAFSKHYKNEDGSYTAIIGVVPIHYRKNEGSAYVDIDTEIKKNSSQTFPYANTTNLFESYYGAKVSDGIKSKTSEGEIHEFLKPQLYWEVNGQAVNIQNYADVPVAVKGEKAYYNNLFGNISAEFITEIGKRKLNYIIPTKKDLGTIPAGADYLVFSEDVALPNGWTYTITERGILIKDQNRKHIYMYDNPVSSDNVGLSSLRDKNTVFETFVNGNILTIKTKVKTTWLLDSNRQFPVKVDPTTNATANGGRTVASDGFEDTLGYFGYIASYFTRYFIKFDTSGIPSGSTVTSTVGYFYIYGTSGTYNAANSCVWASCLDPTTASGTTLYNSATNNTISATITGLTNTAQWKNGTFTTTGNTYVQNSINNNGYVAAAIAPTGSWNNNRFLGARTHNDTEKPYLAITYTIPAMTCSTLSNLTSSLGTPANGLNHMLRLDWTALTGATSYDVQFSTDGTNYANATPSNVPNNYADLNAGDYPNSRYWFRVRAKNATNTCEWTYSAPIYTAADNPAAPLMVNNVGSLQITLQNETPVANPAITTYSIRCTTTNQYVQADGSLGAIEVFRTRADWGTITLSGIPADTEYCFYAKAKNGDGDVRFNASNTLCTTRINAVAPVFHNYGGTTQLAFNNSRIETNTPVFRLSHSGIAANNYQIQISTDPNFGGTPLSQNFSGTYPINTETNFIFNSSFTPVNNTTYYVRARIDTGFGYGLWSQGTYSFTYQTPKDVPGWFQTTQAQFQTDALSGVNADGNNDVVAPSGGNVVVNGTFANTSGWTTYKTSGTGAIIDLSSTDCSNCPTGTTRNLKMYLWTASVLSGDMMIVSQQVDLTNVNQITYNANSYYGPNNSNPGGAISNLRFIIGGASNNEAGTVMHTTTQAYCPTYCTTQVSDQNITIDTSGFTGVQTIKFVVKFTATHTTAGLLAFYVNNVEGHTSSSGTITSAPIHYASVQDATGYDIIRWNQTLGGGTLNLKLQGSADGVIFTDIPGYTAISQTGDGEKTSDISAINPVIYPHLRLEGTLNGAGVKLHDWAVEFKKMEPDCASETKWTSTGWTNGVPDGTGAKKKIVFETDYNSSVNPSNNGALVGCSAEVKNTANVTLESYHSLTIDNEIKIASGASFVLKSDASLLQINNEPDNDNEGVIKVERQITESSPARKEYNYLSSPVIGQNMKKLFGNNVSNTPFALVLDEPSNLFVNAKDSDYQVKAKGFAVKEPKPAYSGTLAEYSGEPVNGEFDIQITKSANNRGWNLVGNPYPSGLDLHSLYYSLENDDVINPEFRFWDNRVNNTYTQYGGNYNGYSYAIYNATTGANGTGNPAPGGDAGDNTNGTPGPATPIAGGFRFVKVGQGFLVRAKNLGTAELNFSNDFRTITQTTDDGFFGKSAQTQDDRYRLQLITPDEMVLTNTVVYFESGNNTFGTEDSKHPSPSASDAFYSFAEEEKVVINGRSSFTDTDIIRLGANHYTSGIYKIRVVDAAGIFPYSQRIYLKDKENNTITDLSGGEYVFSSESGSFTNRFEIVYQPEATLGIAGNTSNIVIYRDGEDFVIRSAKQIRAVELYDISGKLMLVLKKSGKEIRVNAGRMAEGIYILKVEREDGANTMKKIRK